MPDRPLGRIAPTDWNHVDRYPLTADVVPPGPVPVVLGINWYPTFDRPYQGPTRGSAWRVDVPPAHEAARGGHCVCLEPAGPRRDKDSWWHFYDQGAEGACVGFGSSRMSSIFNRKRYDAHWLYVEAQKVDEWPGEAYEGTSVRAGMDILRERGHCVVRGSRTDRPRPVEGIRANRWATTVEDVLAALGTPDTLYVTVLNSWGTDYPHRVRMPVEALARLLAEDGEAAVATDR